MSHWRYGLIPYTFYKAKLEIIPLKFGVFGFYTAKFQNLDFNPWSFGVFGFYILAFQNLDFIS